MDGRKGRKSFGPLSCNIKLNDGNLVSGLVGNIKSRTSDARVMGTTTETLSDDNFEGTAIESTQEDQDVTLSDLVSLAPVPLELPSDGSAELSVGLCR